MRGFERTGSSLLFVLSCTSPDWREGRVHHSTVCPKKGSPTATARDGGPGRRHAARALCGSYFRLDLSSGIGGFRETLHRVPKKRKLHRVEHGFCPPPPSGRSGSCLSTLTGASEIQWWSGSCASDPPPSKNGQWMSLFGVITTKP